MTQDNEALKECLKDFEKTMGQRHWFNPTKAGDGSRDKYYDTETQAAYETWQEAWNTRHQTQPGDEALIEKLEAHKFPKSLDDDKCAQLHNGCIDDCISIIRAHQSHENLTAQEQFPGKRLKPVKNSSNITEREARESQPQGVDKFFEHHYEDCQDLINPYLGKPINKCCGDGYLIPSVLESLEFLIEFWVASGKKCTPSPAPVALDDMEGGV